MAVPWAADLAGRSCHESNRGTWWVHIRRNRGRLSVGDGNVQYGEAYTSQITPMQTPNVHSIVVDGGESALTALC